jgi:hypothetical protein
MNTVWRAGVRLPLLGTEDFSSGRKRSGSVGDHSTAFYYTGQEWWSYISAPSYVSMARCLIRHMKTLLCFMTRQNRNITSWVIIRFLFTKFHVNAPTRVLLFQPCLWDTTVQTQAASFTCRQNKSLPAFPDSRRGNAYTPNARTVDSLLKHSAWPKSSRFDVDKLMLITKD